MFSRGAEAPQPVYTLSFSFILSPRRNMVPAGIDCSVTYPAPYILTLSPLSSRILTAEGASYPTTLGTVWPPREAMSEAIRRMLPAPTMLTILLPSERSEAATTGVVPARLSV